MNAALVRNYFFFAAFLGVLILSFFLFKPFLTTLALAAVIATMFYPLYARLVRMVPFAAGAPAALTATLLVILVVLTPLALLGFLLVQEAWGVYQTLSSGGLGQARFFPIAELEQTINNVVPGVTLNVTEYIRQGARIIAQSLGPLFSGTAHAVFLVLLGLISLYYFFKDGPNFIQTLVRYSPLDDAHDQVIFSRMKTTINSVIQGSIAIAVIQGLVTAIGLLIFGVPNALLWGSVAAVGALIPSVGTALILLPAVTYLFLTGDMGAAIGLSVWGIVAVGLIDNFLGPRLMGRGVALHPLFVLFSVLGGLAFFGPAGFILGPLVVSLTAVLGEIYIRLVSEAV